MCVPPLGMPGEVGEVGEVGVSRSPVRERAVTPEDERWCACVSSAGFVRVRDGLLLLPLRARAGVALGLGPMGSRWGESEGEGVREGGEVGESKECGCAIVLCRRGLGLGEDE